MGVSSGVLEMEDHSGTRIPFVFSGTQGTLDISKQLYAQGILLKF